MSQRRKYTPEEKIKIVKEYLSGHSSLKEIGARYGYTSRQGYTGCYWRWIALYREHGETAFFRKGNERFKHILGYRRMTLWINHFNHTDYKEKCVHRIMKKLGIHSVIRPKKKKYISSTPETIAENVLQRDF